MKVSSAPFLHDHVYCVAFSPGHRPAFFLQGPTGEREAVMGVPPEQPFPIRFERIPSSICRLFGIESDITATLLPGEEGLSDSVQLEDGKTSLPLSLFAHTSVLAYTLEQTNPDDVPDSYISPRAGPPRPG